MAKIRRNDKREMPALNTSSLPDIIFMLLFFFMSVTSMKEVSYNRGGNRSCAAASAGSTVPRGVTRCGGRAAS